MKKKFLFLFLIILSQTIYSQKVFNTDTEKLSIKVNNKLLTANWQINSALNPDILEVECKKKENLVTFTDGKDSISFKVRKNQKIDFIVLKNKTETAYTQIAGIEPNVTFSKKYIKEHNGKTIVEIPEVSELVNIIMALHKDAEKEDNMFDTRTEYYKRVKEYFKPYINHPIIDTIQKYITDVTYNEEHDIKLFSRKSYNYYYALKMNACGYEFDKKGNIKNKGIIKTIAKGWNTFDPMKDISLFEDFARKSNFRKFYQDNKPYYENLLATYNKLNPIQKMQSWLDNKFGFGYGSYAIYFSPLIDGAHSTTRFDEENFSQTLMFICKAEINEKQDPVINELLESRVVFTEIDHNYVNPVSDKFLSKINESFSNREKWTGGDITSSYHNPYMVFNEYMTFAVYSLYIKDNYSAENMMEYLPMMERQMEEHRGFIKFKDFNRVLLAKYQQEPDIKITDLYTYILDWALEVNNT